MGNSSRNPFGGTNAVTLDVQSILDYWCSPFAYRLFSEIKESDVLQEDNNIIIFGGRSTGKTMFLRYWSFPVQIMLARTLKHSKGVSITDYFREKGGVGFYIRIDGLVLRSFAGYQIDDSVWTAVFQHYFELVLGRAYMEVMNVFLEEDGSNGKADIGAFVRDVSSLIDSPKQSVDGILEELDRCVHYVDVFRSEVPFGKKNFLPKRVFPAGNLSFNIPKLAGKYLAPFTSGVKFVLLIDEFENYNEQQQRMINTILRFTPPNVRVRLGSRLEGFRTTSTVSKEEFIKEGREYRKVAIEEVLIKDKGYHEFLRDITKKRLESAKEFRETAVTDISSLLTGSEDLENEAWAISRRNPGKVLDLFAKRIPEEARSLLSYPENPLLELLNVLWYFRGGTTPEVIKQTMEKYLSGVHDDPLSLKYRMDYVDKYKLSLMILLSSLLRRNKAYYSFNTFAFLSSGIVGNFLELCRRSFQYAEFANKDDLFAGKPISRDDQTRAAVDLANAEIQQLTRIDEHGGRIYRFVRNMGNIFREFHKDERIRYPETNQFSLDSNTIPSKEHKDAFLAAIRWSAIQRKPGLQSAAPGRPLGEIYVLNHIFCPTFQISYRTRGGYSVALSGQHAMTLMDGEDINPSDYFPRPRTNKSDIQENFEFTE
ncbi:MAG: hypothetical protein WBD36_02980 [Bacteroidota bacterium]